MRTVRWLSLGLALATSAPAAWLLVPLQGFRQGLIEPAEKALVRELSIVGRRGAAVVAGAGAGGE